MKIIKENDKKTVIVLDNQDELEISSLDGNKGKIIIKCINSIIHIDELKASESILLNEEEKAIESMKNYLKENEDE